MSDCIKKEHAADDSKLKDDLGDNVEEDEYQYESDTSSYAYSSDSSEEGASKQKKFKTETNPRPKLKMPLKQAVAISKHSQYQVISPTSLATQQNLLIADVASLLSVPNGKASLLLRHFFWDKEKLLDKYWSDPDGVSAAAGYD
jgi:ariadne-1